MKTEPKKRQQWKNSWFNCETSDDKELLRLASLDLAEGLGIEPEDYLLKKIRIDPFEGLF